MEAARTLRVRLDTLSHRHFACVFVAAAAMLAISLGIGAAGPAINIAATATAQVDLFGPSAPSCVTDSVGRVITPIPRCWQWTFLINSRFTQSFELRLQPRMRSGSNTSSTVREDLSLQVQWRGQPLTGGDMIALADGNVSRRIDCSAGVCERILIVRTSYVPYTRYYFQISVPTPPPGIDTNIVFDMMYVYRNPDFSLFELGFKSTWFAISVLLLVAYVGLNACDVTCCGRFGIICLCARMCGRNSELPFQRLEGNKWLYAMVVGLVLFNEPLLGLTYYAPAATVKLVSVAMQLTFIALLLSYWLVEFGFLKSNPQNAGRISCARFYAPKLIACAVYWISAVAMYGYVLLKMQTDPLYNWVQDASANTFLRLWGGVTAAVYVLYLAWLIIRGLTTIRSWLFGEIYLFSLHMTVLLATALGLAGGLIYGADLVDGLSFMFYNALFNMYIPVLMYLYTPVMYEALGGAPAQGANAPAGTRLSAPAVHTGRDEHDSEHGAASVEHAADEENSAPDVVEHVDDIQVTLADIDASAAAPNFEVGEAEDDDATASQQAPATGEVGAAPSTSASDAPAAAPTESDEPQTRRTSVGASV